MDIQTLADTLNLISESESNECLDFMGAHGFLTALIANPSTRPLEAWFDKVLGISDPDTIPAETSIDEIKQGLSLLCSDIDQNMHSDEGFELPCEVEADPEEFTDLQAWCCGFVECFLLTEEMWLNHAEKEVAELLLPIMAVSELFDEAEFIELYENPDLLAQSAEQVPDSVTDLYLLLRDSAPGSKKASKAH